MMHCGFHYKQGCKIPLPATLNTLTSRSPPTSLSHLQLLQFFSGARSGHTCPRNMLSSQQAVLLQCNWREDIDSILKDHHRTSSSVTTKIWTCPQVNAIAIRVLKDIIVTTARQLESICLNPKALSTETVEFMLEVQTSNQTLSKDESEDASRVDLVLKGVHPGTFQPVLIVCVTTVFPLSMTIQDVEKAVKRAQLWEKAVGPEFLVMALVAGFGTEPSALQFAKEQRIICCDLNSSSSKNVELIGLD
ncbi:unnamed protein product [Sphagnum troendelagicum]|uniref:Uncharacterized protein n=1 Tax=Sphagnum troendelagicum TaxID=128251 RepID=A0ABP0TTC6_9BRYO